MTAFAPRPDGRVAPTALRLKAWIRRSLVHHSRGRQPQEDRSLGLLAGPLGQSRFEAEPKTSRDAL